MCVHNELCSMLIEYLKLRLDHQASMYVTLYSQTMCWLQGTDQYSINYKEAKISMMILSWWTMLWVSILRQESRQRLANNTMCNSRFLASGTILEEPFIHFQAQIFYVEVQLYFVYIPCQISFTLIWDNNGLWNK